MRTRMYGGVRGRKTKVGGKPTFVFLLLDLNPVILLFDHHFADEEETRVSGAWMPCRKLCDAACSHLEVLG